MTKREEELTEAVKELLEVIDEFKPYLPLNPNPVQISHAKARTMEREAAVMNARQVLRNR